MIIILLLAMVEEGALQALFSLSNTIDIMSQYYVAYTLANLSSNERNHRRIVEMGGIQPIVSLCYRCVFFSTVSRNRKYFSI